MFAAEHTGKIIRIRRNRKLPFGPNSCAMAGDGTPPDFMSRRVYGGNGRDQWTVGHIRLYDRRGSGVRIRRNGKLPFDLNPWAMAGGGSTPAAYVQTS
jgi:hypothetical protein